jgi:hypothetical protein
MWWRAPKYTSGDIELLRERLVHTTDLSRPDERVLIAILRDENYQAPDGKVVRKRIRKLMRSQKPVRIAGLDAYIVSHSDVPSQMKQLMFQKKLEDMPEFLGGQYTLGAVVAAWRLEIGK